MNAVDVLVLETLGRVPSAGTCRLVALILARLAEEILEFLPAPARGKAARDRETRNSRCDEKKIAFVVTFDYPGSVVLILRVQPFDPEIGRFHHVRISRDNVLCRHGSTSCLKARMPLQLLYKFSEAQFNSIL